MIRSVFEIIVIDILFCADAPQPRFNLDQLRQVSLQKVFEGARYDKLDHLTHGLPPDRVCRWGANGFDVECDGHNQLVTLIIDNYTLFPHMRIGFLPGYVKVLSLTRCRQEWSINTRVIPMSCEKVDLSNNLITGTPDLSCLPPKIQYLQLSYNLNRSDSLLSASSFIA